MRTKNAMQLKAIISNRAKEGGVPPQLVMQSYLLERLLERISLSPWRDSVVVKGGVLISSLMGVDRRSTKDLDATVRGFPLTHENAERAFREIAAVEADDDFSFEFVRTEDIRETDDYPGIRVHLLASYEKMRSPVTVDVTTGDKITPDAVEYSYPLMFDNRSLLANGLPAPHHAGGKVGDGREPRHREHTPARLLRPAHALAHKEGGGGARRAPGRPWRLHPGSAARLPRWAATAR